MFSACASLSNDRAIQLGNQLFQEMPPNFKNHPVVLGSTLNMFMKFGQVKDAEDLFSSTKKRSIEIYGAMMNGFNINEQPNKCLMLFEQVERKEFFLNEAICLALINAASQIGMRSICQKFAELIPNEFQKNLHVETALLDMWVGYFNQNF